jgi:hypothetical protein
VTPWVGLGGPEPGGVNPGGLPQTKDAGPPRHPACPVSKDRVRVAYGALILGRDRAAGPGRARPQGLRSPVFGEFGVIRGADRGEAEAGNADVFGKEMRISASADASDAAASGGGSPESKKIFRKARSKSSADLV